MSFLPSDHYGQIVLCFIILEVIFITFCRWIDGQAKSEDARALFGMLVTFGHIVPLLLTFVLVLFLKYIGVFAGPILRP